MNCTPYIASFATFGAPLGVSSDAKVIAERYQNDRECPGGTASAGELSLSSIRTELLVEFGADGWDGASARAVSEASWEYAKRIIEALSHKYEMPAVSVEHDGSVRLDWVFSRSRMLSVCVREDGVAYFAARAGDGYRIRGGERIGAGVPKSILDSLQRVFR